MTQKELHDFLEANRSLLAKANYDKLYEEMIKKFGSANVFTEYLLKNTSVNPIKYLSEVKLNMFDIDLGKEFTVPEHIKNFYARPTCEKLILKCDRYTIMNSGVKTVVLDNSQTVVDLGNLPCANVILPKTLKILKCSNDDVRSIIQKVIFTAYSYDIKIMINDELLEQLKPKFFKLRSAEEVSESLKLTEAMDSSLPKELVKSIVSMRDFIPSNIQLDKAKFIPYPVPAGARAFKIKNDPDKLVFMIFPVPWNSDKDVWIINRNDPYIAALGKAAMRSTWTELLETCSEIYYIDLTDPSNFVSGTPNEYAKDKSRTLRDYMTSTYRDSKEIPDLTTYRYSQKEVDKAASASWRIDKNKVHLDKSGYLVDPRRLIKKLEQDPNYGVKRASKNIENVYRRIQDAYDNLLYILQSNVPQRNSSGELDKSGPWTAIGGFMNDELRNISNRFNSAVSYANELPTLTDADERRDVVREINRYLSQVTDALDSIDKEITKYKKSYFSSWADVPEIDMSDLD